MHVGFVGLRVVQAGVVPAVPFGVFLYLPWTLAYFAAAFISSVTYLAAVGVLLSDLLLDLRLVLFFGVLLLESSVSLHLSDLSSLRLLFLSSRFSSLVALLSSAVSSCWASVSKWVTTLYFLCILT